MTQRSRVHGFIPSPATELSSAPLHSLGESSARTLTRGPDMAATCKPGSLAMEALPGDLGTIHSITLAARITRASRKDPHEQG